MRLALMVNFSFRRSFNTRRPVQHDQINLFKNFTLKIPNSQKHCSKQKLMRREPRRQTGNLQSKRRPCRELSQNCAEQMPLLEVTISFGSSVPGKVKKVPRIHPQFFKLLMNCIVNYLKSLDVPLR